ncbi:MAG: glutamate--tRNA ligase [Patescibacteria group bacterium]|nr:MAG: glutamate--tRNA ligase [Patescibacteria group bacterium]
MQVKTRVAPSPTGAPHVGTAYIALFDFAFARKHGGKFLLRIEDTDQKRLVKGAEEQILDVLTWLGLTWDEGPVRQSERLSIYKEHVERLVKKGRAYYCFCSPARLEESRHRAQKKGLPPRYDGLCRQLDSVVAEKRAKKEKFVIRLKVPENGETVFKDLIRGEIRFENQVIGDQVLLKSDGYPTYHLAVVVDDHLMEVTHVFRGEDWISSTPKHVLLYESFGWPLPQFAHFPVLRETNRSKLSKRHGSVGVLEFREEGYLPEALLNFLALLGWSYPGGKDIFSLDEFIKEVDLSRVSSSAPIFDREKLNWMNGEYIRRLSVRELSRRVGEYLQAYRGIRLDSKLLEGTVPLVRERIKKLAEFEDLAGFFFNDVAWTRDKLLVRGESSRSAVEKLGAVVGLLSDEKKWEAEVLERKTRALVKRNDWKASDLFMLMRVAVTGRTISPPLFESMEVLGKEKSLARLSGALAVVG